MRPRRVVTGIDAAGRSVFLHDGPTPGVLDLGLGIDTEIWSDDPRSPGAAAVDPAAASRHSLTPPPGGSKFRLWTFPPDPTEPPTADEFAVAVRSLDAVFDAGGTLELDNPGFHTTSTIDYGVVLSGEIVLVLDDGEVTLRPGDVYVQRATRHAWSNRTMEPCTIAVVLVDQSA